MCTLGAEHEDEGAKLSQADSVCAEDEEIMNVSNLLNRPSSGGA